MLLGCDGHSTRAVFHALRAAFGPVAVVLEEPVPHSQLLKRRLTTLGLRTVAGQVAFMALVQPVLKRRARRRIAEICGEHALESAAIQGPVTRVPSVNSPEARKVLAELQPAVVVVNGTRIIGKETLRAVRCPMINTHAGITPLYRGVHGGYWALADGRPELVGTTVHLIDAGIDTGTILGQATFPISPEDTFATYPYLHTAAGLPVLIAAVRAALAGTLAPRAERPGLESKLRSHPTLWGYVVRRLRDGIR